MLEGGNSYGFHGSLEIQFILASVVILRVISSIILQFSTSCSLHTPGAYNGAVPIKKAVPHIIICWELFLLLAGRAKTDWHSDTVIRHCGTLLSVSFVMDICKFVRLDTGVLVISEYFLDVL